MRFIIIICILIIGGGVSAFLIKTINNFRRPRYIKKNGFFYMSNGNSHLNTTGKNKVTVGFHYTNAKQMFIEDEVHL